MKTLRSFLVEMRDNFLMALQAVTAHKLRSLLTLLGVLVGVFSIILVMTAMRAMEEKIQSDLNRLGGETFLVQRRPTIMFDGPHNWQKYRRRKHFSLELGRELARRATLASSIGLEDDELASGSMISRYGKSPPTISISGETPGSFPAQNWTIAEGRSLVDADVGSARDVCVLGSALAKSLFPYGSPVGERVSFNNINYTVVGVLAEKGAMQGSHQDNFALIPITTGVARYEDASSVDLTFLVQARSAAAYEETVEQVRGILRILRKVPPGAEDDFEIISADSLMAQMRGFTGKLRVGITLVSFVALLAAGIGIMNIMLVSVTERTREIGVRRAIGAKKRSILAQFIFEAVLLCQAGGLMGVILGVAGGDLAAHFLELPQVLPTDWIVIGLCICSAVGIVFGTYPAIKAANLDPIESLRYE